MSAAGTAVLVGNPKPASRTRSAAEYVAHELTGSDADLVIDLADLGPRLLDWSDDGVTDLVAQVSAAELVVVASPTYKASFTGLLKLFLDRCRSLDGVAIPFMLGGSPAHSLAPEHALRPVLVELGAIVPVRGLYVVESAHDDPSAYADWLGVARDRVRAHLRRAGAS